MGILSVENNTNNALKVDLATRLAGERTSQDKDWIETNSRGYLKTAGKLVTVSSSNTPVNIGQTGSLQLGVDTEVISVYNPGPVRIWFSVRQAVYANSQLIPSAIPVEPGLAVTLPVHSENVDSVQLSFIRDAGTGDIQVSVMVAGNQ